MDELEIRARELMAQGFNCSQIMLILSHDMRNISNPELIKALAGLGGGMSSQLTCGTLTGGCCLISSYIAKGEPGEDPKMPHNEMVKELVNWFKDEFGSLECKDLVELEREKILEFCPGLIAKNFNKAMELLSTRSVDIYE